MSTLTKMQKNARREKQASFNKDVNNSGSKSYKDDRFWKPTVETNGRGYAVVRLLPNGGVKDTCAHVEVRSHGFQGPKGWYIDPCASSVGGNCPVCEASEAVKNNGGGWSVLNPEDKNLVRKLKYNTHRYMNILILQDDKNPASVGKVFLWKISPSIWKKIDLAMNPEFGEDPLVPTDFDFGNDFRIKIVNDDKGWRNYDLSEFASESELFDGDAKQLKALTSQLYDLSEFEKAGHYPDYDSALSKYNKVTGGANTPVTESASDEPAEVLQKQVSTLSPAAKGQADSMVDYFKSMAE
jgi:hypothetical protein